MLLLEGVDALHEALWIQGENPFSPRVTFFLRKEGERIPVSPCRIRTLLEEKQAVPDDFICEIVCVWDILPPQEPNPALAFYPAGDLMIIRNRFFGEELVCRDANDSNDRWFATPRSAFESASSWAKSTPVLESEYSIDEFLNKLFPRIFFRAGSWKNDCVLLRYSKELSETLIRIFGLNPDDLQKAAEESSMNFLREEDSRGQPDGILFDTVLECLRRK